MTINQTAEGLHLKSQQIENYSFFHDRPLSQLRKYRSYMHCPTSAIVKQVLISSSYIFIIPNDETFT